MPRPPCSRIQSGPIVDIAGSTPAPAAISEALSADQIDCWAELIAAGRDEVPAHLAIADRERLKAAVRHRLRDRLVRLVARAIAMNLHREVGKT